MPDFNFDAVRPTKTTSGLVVTSDYDLESDTIVLTIVGSKKCYKPSGKTEGNWVCPINHEIRRSLKINGNLIVFT